MSNTFNRIQNLINQIQQRPANRKTNFSHNEEINSSQKLRMLTYQKLKDDYYIDSDGDIATEFFEATPEGGAQLIITEK
eukprot:gene1760-529_t